METSRVILTVLVLVSSASGCCFPKQAEGFQGMSLGMTANGTGYGITGLYKTAIDADRQMVYLEGDITINGGPPMRELMLDDYGKGKEYIVINGKCKVQALPRKQLTCIPPDAKLVMSSFYGFGKNKIDFNMYSFVYGGMGLTLAVTKPENGVCIPISEHVTAPNTMADIGFMGLQSGITNSSVFDIPAACKRFGAQEHEIHEKEYLKYRRHSLIFH